MYSPSFVSELFKPQEVYTVKSVRQVFDRLAHSSIMRLNEASMDKLFDLMVMGFKYQLLSCRSPPEILVVTLNHLRALRGKVASDPAVAQLIAAAQEKVEQVRAAPRAAAPRAARTAQPTRRPPFRLPPPDVRADACGRVGAAAARALLLFAGPAGEGEHLFAERDPAAGRHDRAQLRRRAAALRARARRDQALPAGGRRASHPLVCAPARGPAEPLRRGGAGQQRARREPLHRRAHGALGRGDVRAGAELDRVCQPGRL